MCVVQLPMNPVVPPSLCKNLVASFELCRAIFDVLFIGQGVIEGDLEIFWVPVMSK